MSRLDYFPMGRGPVGAAINVVGGWLITSYFGGRIDPIRGVPGTHGGQDMAYVGCLGVPFYAVVSGRVSQSYDNSGGGKWTSLVADNGDYYGYGHALNFAPGVSGTYVQAGTLLGYVDSTGGSTGSHMHFAFKPAGAGSYRDPYDLLKDAADNGRFVGEPTDNTQSPLEGDDEMTPEDKQWVVDQLYAQNKYLTDLVYNTGKAGEANTNTAVDNAVNRLEDTNGKLLTRVTQVRDEYGKAFDAHYEDAILGNA